MSESKVPDDLPRVPTPTAGTRRVPANEDLPKLRKKTEDRVRPADEKSAHGYDLLEDAMAKMDELKHQIEGGHITVELQVGDTATHSIRENLIDPRK